MSTNANIRAASEFGKRLKSERLRLGLTQQEMANAGGVRRATQYLYERGERLPAVDYVIGVLATGANLQYLFTGYRAPSASDLLVFDREALANALASADQMCRDEKGRLLDPEFRIQVTINLLEGALSSEARQSGSVPSDAKAPAHGRGSK